MAYPDYTKIISQIPINLPLSIPFLIGALVEILISGFTLWLAVKMVGGKANFLKALLFSLLMKFINLFVFPSITVFLGIFLTIILGLFLWLILVMSFFKVGFLKAIGIAMLQVIVSIILVFLAIGAVIISLIGIANL
ncbi:MAG: hypothetical protein QMD36_06440 [Candidatus Aenigmarchaeota archaeon]|nr:hypothetical protein [Candidatus Aenigmarchaeota archaeon]